MHHSTIDLPATLFAYGWGTPGAQLEIPGSIDMLIVELCFGFCCLVHVLHLNKTLQLHVLVLEHNFSHSANPGEDLIQSVTVNRVDEQGNDDE